MRIVTLGIGASLLAAAPAQADTAVLTYTADSAFRVPPGITAVEVVAAGGQGSPGSFGLGTPQPGGRGFLLSGRLATIPGTVLTIRVGHGGAGGPAAQFSGGAGGGLAAVLRNGIYQVVAGGGGGGSGGAGGDAGSPEGVKGADGTDAGSSAGGGAGTQTAAGGGGATNGAGSGAAGSSGAGGAGGFGAGFFGTGGGGGGAGFFGGGGGGGSLSAAGGGGGGGGSSFWSTAAFTGVRTAVGAGAASLTISFADAAAPSVSLDAPGANPGVLSGSAGIDGGDAATVTLELARGGAPALTLSAPVSPTGSYSVPVAGLADATWTARASQTDAGGNTGTSLERTFVVDSAAPALSMTAPGPFVRTARPRFTGVAGALAGDLSPVSIEVAPAGGGPPVTFSGDAAAGAFGIDASSDLADGTYTAVARQDDAFGNHGASAARTFTVDTVAPAPTLTASGPSFSGAAGTAAGDDRAVVIDVFHAGAVVRSISAPVVDGTYTATADALADGVYTVAASQSDAAGNRGANAPQVFAVDTSRVVAPAIKQAARLKIDSGKASQRGRALTVKVRAARSRGPAA
jgi:hypothetical protein